MPVAQAWTGRRQPRPGRSPGETGRHGVSSDQGISIAPDGAEGSGHGGGVWVTPDGSRPGRPVEQTPSWLAWADHGSREQCMVHTCRSKAPNALDQRVSAFFDTMPALPPSIWRLACLHVVDFVHERRLTSRRRRGTLDRLPEARCCTRLARRPLCRPMSSNSTSSSASWTLKAMTGPGPHAPRGGRRRSEPRPSEAGSNEAVWPLPMVGGFVSGLTPFVNVDLMPAY